MVDIIERGRLPQDKRYEVQCYSCKTRFSFQRWEAEFVPDYRDGGFLRIKCPLPDCNELVTHGV